MPSAEAGQVRHVVEEACKRLKVKLVDIKYEGYLAGNPWYIVYIKQWRKREKEIRNGIILDVRFLGIAISVEKFKPKTETRIYGG
jgi:hypothetical protein